MSDEEKLGLLEEELRRLREEHERTARILDLVLRHMPAFYWVVDRDLRIVYTGGGIAQTLGYPSSRWIGRTLHDALAADASTTDTIGNHQRALDGEVVHSESRYRDKLLTTTIGPYFNSTGEIIGAIGTSVDVTGSRELERRMIDTQRAESLGVLAGGLAHDFNNLLVAVLGNADLALREVKPGAPGRAAIENIRTAGLRAAELTDQLLAYAGRGGAGTTRVEPAALVEELLRIIAASIPDDVKIHHEIPARLAVRGDPAQLRQVLLNLINNAREALAGRGGHIVLRADAVHTDGAPTPDDILIPPAGSHVVIEIEDDGPGMNAETRRHIFEPFFTTKTSGHGLGLAAMLGIVRAHGGGIRVVSTPGRGTRMQVLWPAAVTGPVRTQPELTPSTRTVLVIDDEDLVRDVVARMVEDLGYAAVTAADGKSGLALADRADLALVDLTMPEMSGAEVVAALRAKRPGLPVIVCSGYDRGGKAPALADAYLPKPFRIDALERTLAKLLPLRNV